MISRDPEEAVAQFVEQLRTTTGCITQVPLTAQPSGTGVFHVIFHGGGPVELRTDRGHPSILLSVVHHCRPVQHPGVHGRYIVESTYYAYEILDLDERELLVFHWHPEGMSPETHPHLHLSTRIPPIEVASSRHDPQYVSLPDMHIPTGYIRLEDVVRVLITAFKVRPLRRDWVTILDQNARRMF